MSDIQLPYGYVKNNKQIQFNLPKGYEEEQYLKDVPYIRNQDPAAKKNLLNLIKIEKIKKNGCWRLVLLVTKYKMILMQ